MNEFLQKLAEHSTNAIPINEDDYIKDGLLYCGKCHTPKQKRFVVGGKTIMPRMLCSCETEKRDQEEAEAKRQKQLQYIEDLRKTGIQDSKLLSCSFDCDDNPQSKHSQAFRRYCDKWEEMRAKNIGLIFFGGVGTGKSFRSEEHTSELQSR